ncbi:translocation and assembly module protein TamB, partial [Thioclava sp. BHET1]
SSPQLPQEEVLSQLLVGRGLDKITPFQAAQLAAAVATLAGNGGDGIIGNLRKNFGLDNLDLSTDSTGATQLSAGKYISKRLYSEVSVGSAGTTEVHLNLDVTKSIKLSGTAGSDGDSGIGIYYDRDY